jgi:hypothetical protein
VKFSEEVAGCAKAAGAEGEYSGRGNWDGAKGGLGDWDGEEGGFIEISNDSSGLDVEHIYCEGQSTRVGRGTGDDASAEDD